MDERDRAAGEPAPAPSDDPAESPEALEDMDVADGDAETVKGGFKQAWPKKWDGG